MRITAMRWLLLAALVAAIIPAAPAIAAPGGTPPSCVSPAIMLETQSWVRAGAEHVHTQVCWDPTRTTAPAGYQWTVRTLLHNTNSHLRLVRLATDASVLESHSMDIPGANSNEVVRFDTFTLAASQTTRELRFTSDARDPDLDPNLGTAGRWYDTTRFQGDNEGRVGTAGWCVGHLYTNIYMLESDFDAYIARQNPVPDQWTIHYKAEDNLATVATDPALHASPPDPGHLWVNRGPGGNVWRTVTIDTSGMAAGTHRLMLVDTDNAGEFSPFGECSGVFTMPFVVQ